VYQNAWHHIPIVLIVIVVRTGVCLDNKWVIGGISPLILNVITGWK